MRKFAAFLAATALASAVAIRRRRALALEYPPVAAPSPHLEERFRDELYEQAPMLDRPGRSRMRESELERSVAERMSGAAA